jgi:hypothetical protein
MKRHSLIYLAGSVLMALSLPIVALCVGDKRAGEGSPIKLPATLDLLKYQTSVRNQSGRGVCPYFAPVAALEAAYRRAGEKVELSEEHLIWLRNVTACGDSGNRYVAENLLSTLGGGNGMGVLAAYAICRAQDLPYRENVDQRGFGVEKYDWGKPFSQFVLNRWNFDPHQLPPAARANARYAIGRYTTMPATDLRNPTKFEEILASEHEIVFTLMVHDDIHQLDPAQPIWRLKPGSRTIGNHFMLMVGYDSQRKFFIVKNQWGPTNYSGQKDRLAPGWEDIVRYDGYTLVDYNYLSACGEGHWITEVVPADSLRFNPQRALGQWSITFARKNKPVMKGVLCWRRLPSDEGGKLAIPLIADHLKTASPTWTPPAHLKLKMKQANWRIGDLVTADGQEFRVNAALSGDAAEHIDVSIHIDFRTGAISTDSKDGTTWEGSLTLPKNGPGLMNLNPANASNRTLWDVPASELQVTAVLVGNKNLLKDTPPPKSVNGGNIDGK